VKVLKRQRMRCLEKVRMKLLTHFVSLSILGMVRAEVTG
jgi:hypothetical protein